MATADSAPPYARVRAHAQEMTLESHRVKVALLDDLIAMKKGAGRSKSLGYARRAGELVQLRQLVERGQDE